MKRKLALVGALIFGLSAVSAAYAETTIWEVTCKGMNGEEHTKKVRVTADSREKANDLVTKNMTDTMFCRDRYNIDLRFVEVESK